MIPPPHASLDETGPHASGGEYYNALSPFLGPLTKAVRCSVDRAEGLSRASQIDSHPSDGFPHEAYFLPDAYKVPVPLSCLFLSALSLSLSRSGTEK